MAEFPEKIIIEKVTTTVDGKVTDEHLVIKRYSPNGNHFRDAIRMNIPTVKALYHALRERPEV